MDDKAWADFQKQMDQKMIAEWRAKYPLTIGDYLHQQFPDDADTILKRENIPADYALIETQDVFRQNCISCARNLTNGEKISYAYFVHPRWPIVQWFLYPKVDPNPPGTRTFEQMPDAAELAAHTRLSIAEAVNLLEMTDEMADINQAAWMSIKGETFGAICAQLFDNDERSSEG